MTADQLRTLATNRHGKHWITLMAQEIGWSYWTLQRAAKGTIPISPKLERAVKALKPIRSKRREA